MKNQFCKWMTIGVVVCIVIGCAGLSSGVRQMRWEENYQSALRTLSPSARSIISSSCSYWKSIPMYGRLRSLIKQHIDGQVHSAIRIETCNLNESTYFCTWIFEDARKVLLCASHPGLKDEPVCQEIQPGKYKELWQTIERNQAWSLTPDVARVDSVLDGTTYFISLYREPRSHQFFVYAPNLSPHGTDPYGLIIKTVLGLADKTTNNE